MAVFIVLFLWWLLSMKKSFLSLLTWYARIRYILCIESKKRCPIKIPKDRTTRSCLKANGKQGKPFKSVSLSLSNKMSLRSRNALIKIPVLLVRSWLLLRHWQKRRQIKALVLLNTVRGTAPTHISTRSIIIMNHFLFPVNGTGVPLHAFGGV